MEIQIENHNLTIIRDAALRLRNAMDKADFTGCVANLQMFPRESCHHASALLLVYFHDLGISGFGRMLGGRPDPATVIERDVESGHWWIQRGSIVVDITADQFVGHDMPAVFVGESSWHNKLNGVPYRDALLDSYIPFYKQQTHIFDRLVATGFLSPSQRVQ